MSGGGDTTISARSAGAPATTGPAVARRTPGARELSGLARTIASEPVPQAISPSIIAGTLRAAEFGMILGIGAGLYFGYVRQDGDLLWHYMAASGAIACAAFLVFQLLGLYTISTIRTHIYQLSRLAGAWSLVFLLAIALSFFAKFDSTYSRFWAASFYTVGLVALLADRLFVTALVRGWARAGRLVRRVIIVGGGRAGESLIEALNAEADSDLRICGVFDDRGDDRSPVLVAGVPKLGTVDDLVEFT